MRRFGIRAANSDRGHAEIPPACQGKSSAGPPDAGSARQRNRMRTSRTGGGWRESIDESEPGEPGCGYGFLAGALSCFFC